MRITGYNPYSSVRTAAKAPVAFDGKREQPHLKNTRTHTALPAKQASAKPVQFGGLGKLLAQGASLLGGTAYCVGEGAFWGVQAAPVDIMIGAPITSPAVAGGAFVNCMDKVVTFVKKL